MVAINFVLFASALAPVSALRSFFPSFSPESSTSYALGSHLVTNRVGYTHHGIYVGNGEVVHYMREEGITLTDLAGFSCGHSVRIQEHPNALCSGEECAYRAMSRLGEDNYNLVFNNCEHFANWCVTGAERSDQVRAACTTAGEAAAAIMLCIIFGMNVAAFVALVAGVDLAIAGGICWLFDDYGLCRKVEVFCFLSRSCKRCGRAVRRHSLFFGRAGLFRTVSGVADVWRAPRPRQGNFFPSIQRVSASLPWLLQSACVVRHAFFLRMCQVQAAAWKFLEHYS